MITKRLASTLAVTSVLAFNGLGLTPQDTGIQLKPTVAQAASCDNAVRYVNFSGRVGPGVGVNLRYSRTLSDRSPYSEPYNKTLYFAGWGYGDSVADLWTGQADARWFLYRGRGDGRDYWVPSAYIWGNPPNAPLQPSCNGGALTMSEYFQRLYGHSTGASSSRGYSAHRAIDSTDGISPYEVRALVGGQVRAVKNGVQVANPYNYTTGTCQNNSAAYNGTVEIWNPDLQRTFTYLHFATNSIRVRVGDNVNPGDVIGIEGSTGCSTGRHTHLAVNYGAEDPLVTLANARSRGILNKNYR
jgi:hypothetical protein